MTISKFLYITILLLILSCNSDSEYWVAKYGDSTLYKTELNSIMPNDLSREDSISFVNQYIENWAKNKVLLNNSKEILTEDELTEIEQKVARYREDITTSFLEGKLIETFNDSISKDEIEKYYHDYKDSFTLAEDYVNFNYMSVPKDSASDYIKLLKNGKYDELKKKLVLNSYPNEIKKDNWISKKNFYDTLLLPEEFKNDYYLRSNNQIYTIYKNGYANILEVVEFRAAHEYSPLPLVKDVINNVLINKRKLNLLSKKKKELYNKALQNDEIKRN